MKVVILAGGLGTRISEYTKEIPKPMIKIKGKPIIFYDNKSKGAHAYLDLAKEIIFNAKKSFRERAGSAHSQNEKFN